MKSWKFLLYAFCFISYGCSVNAQVPLAHLPLNDVRTPFLKSLYATNTGAIYVTYQNTYQDAQNSTKFDYVTSYSSFYWNFSLPKRMDMLPPDASTFFFEVYNDQPTDTSLEFSLAYQNTSGFGRVITCSDVFNVSAPWYELGFLIFIGFESLREDISVFWDEPNGHWVTIVPEGTVKSNDLLRWTVLQDATTFDSPMEFFPIKPQNKPANTHWIVISKPDWSPYTTYVVGDLNGTYWNQRTPEKPFDYGPDTFDVVVANDGNAFKSVKILTGAMKCKSMSESDALLSSLPLFYSYCPRQLTFRESQNGTFTLIQRPLIDTQSRYLNNFRLSRTDLRPGDNPLALIHSMAFAVSADFVPDTANSVGFVVRKSFSQGTVIGYRVTEQEFFVDRRRSGYPMNATDVLLNDYLQVYTAPFPRPPNNIISFTAIVDLYSVETFCDIGQIVFSVLIFPNFESDSIEAYTQGGNSIIDNLNIRY